MVVKKPRIVIIGAGMAGLTAANRLYTSHKFADTFDLTVIEGGSRIGGRINTSEFSGDRVEMGATWIHGIGNSPVYKIAQQMKALQSDEPYECMDGFLDDPITVAEGGYVLKPCLVDSVYKLFSYLMNFAQGKSETFGFNDCFGDTALSNCVSKTPSIGCFLRKGLEAYWASINKKDDEEEEEKDRRYGVWREKMLEERLFAMYENTQRTYTSAGNLDCLDYNAESEYRMFPGEEITIAMGYVSVLESLMSVLPASVIQLGRKVDKIEWKLGGERSVKLHFSDGSNMEADHVILTVSLGVLKAGIRDDDSGLFSPSLPEDKIDAISKLGYGVVNKLFLEVSSIHDDDDQESGSSSSVAKFPFLQMVFHQADSKYRDPNIPWWMRRTASLCPIYAKSNVVLSWLAGEEALALESLSDEEILDEVSTTISSFLSNSSKVCNGNGNRNCVGSVNGTQVKFTKVLKSKWGTDPLFLGSYSYVAVGSSGDDIDKLAEPLQENGTLQILFAGEATHRTHYSTTHGAYFSGLREANRLLEYYQCTGL